MSARRLERLAVANRGEIARRIFRTTRRLGIESVALFAPDDRDAPFVTEADRAVALGPPGPDHRTPYLDPARIVGAALAAGADAVHPGYGFLAEDPALARAVEAAGLVWVGPPAEAMEVMGHKARAKAAVEAAGVPVLAGRVVEPNQDLAVGLLEELAAPVGFPLLVKASAGGGGRGMRLVQGVGELPAALEAARREAAAAFGSAELLLERYVAQARHVEVQVLADAHGAVVHLFDRECSIQRRHQKLVEEAPASLVDPAARELIFEAAVQAARAVGYVGAGTVEFVVGPGRQGGASEAAFLEMNTRLQVEHGVTELITGLDLVELQLEVAAGRRLPFGQGELASSGHAIEVRLCAESPRNGHRPTPGRVVHARWPAGPGLRTDAGVESGSTVGTAYDSLLAKILAVGPDREAARRRLRQALRRDLELDGDEGLETNRSLLEAVLGEEDFVSGRLSTDYLERHLEVVEASLPAEVRRRHAAAGSLALEALRHRAALVQGLPPGWRNLGVATHLDRFAEGQDRISVALSRPRGGLQVLVEGPGDLAAPLAISSEPSVAVEEPSGRPSDGTARPPGAGTAGPTATASVGLELDGILVGHRVRLHGPLLAVSSPDGQSTLVLLGEASSGQARPGAGEVRAPLPGSVASVGVAVGQVVEPGSPLVVLEAMKMEHTLRATASGQVLELLVAPGEQVEAGALLVRFSLEVDWPGGEEG